MKLFTEESYEKSIIQFFEQRLGYDHLYGPDIERDYHVPFYKEKVEASLRILNPKADPRALEEALRKISHIENGSLNQNNETFTSWFQNGIDVSYYDGKETKYEHIYLVDFNPNHINRNSFLIVNQWAFVEHESKRPDVIIFINGFPVVLMELKSPSREETDVSSAYRQIKNYMKEIPSLFTYNMFCVMSDMTITKAGTITADEDRYMQWKSKDGVYLSQEVVDNDVFFEGIFTKSRFLDILKNFICFSRTDDKPVKIFAGYHQYFGVNKVADRTPQAIEGDGRIGVFWHTQGSGKSLSMVFYAHLLIEKLDKPTIVVVTDRNDLDNQLYTQFCACKEFLRQTPVRAESRAELSQLLSQQQANGIFFSTIQKFEEGDDALSERSNIIVMADEAHRSQYGFDLRVGDKGNLTIGAAQKMRKALPNASYVGFTGTPIATTDKNTIEVFGEIADVYDMTQSVIDHSTVPVYYESRVINLKLDDNTLAQIDDAYNEMAEQGAEEADLQKSKRELSHMEELLGADETINSLVSDIINHYEKYRQYELTGKAMIVAYSRPIAIKIYKRIMELRPSWTEKVKCVMTSGNNDPEEWRDIIGNGQYKRELAKKFKDNNDPMKIAIVVDMWLTGFDVPSLSTMYVFKPMNGHNLMQAIARVNRVFKGKAGGLVVDYIGIAQALKAAMKFYTSNDQKRFGDPDIEKTAKVEFQKYQEICRDMMHGFDYSNFITGTDLERSELIKGGTNHIIATNSSEDFKKNAMLLKQAYGLCKSLLNEELHWEAAFMETIRIMLVRIDAPGKITKKNIDKRIRALLEQSVQSEGVINLFQDAAKEFSLNDPAFLEEIEKMKEKNLAQKILENIIKERIKIFRRSNIVQSDRFSELFNKALSQYLKGMLTNEEVIKELIKLAHMIKSAEDEGNALGLNIEELAFYDALTKPQAVKDFYSNEELVNLTKELTEQLRQNRTIDWTKKHTARAGMRRLVKRLLKKYKYPPEGVEDAMAIVMKQCELWTDNSEYDSNESSGATEVEMYSYNDDESTGTPMIYEAMEEESMLGMAAEPEGV